MQTSFFEQKNVFTIQVYPHVRKYMMRFPRFPRTTQGVFLCEDTSDLGVYVTRCLTHSRSWKSINDQVRDRATAQIKIMLTDEQMKHSPRLVKMQRLVIDIDRHFKSALLHHIMGLQTVGVPVLTACKTFLEQYNIDEKEYSLDNCYKHWQRSGKIETINTQQNEKL